MKTKFQNLILILSLSSFIACGQSGSSPAPAVDDDIAIISPDTDAGDPSINAPTCTENCSSDTDGDGLSPNDGDCNDADPGIYLSAPEIAGDAIDQDCDGGDAVAPNLPVIPECELTASCALGDETADDDTIDDETAGGTDEEGTEEDVLEEIDEDIDADGYSTVTGNDCNDSDAAINPAAIEIYNDGLDQNCDGSDALLSQIDTGDTNYLWVMTTGDDANDCVFATPCKTIQRAVNAVTLPTQIIIVAEGTYVEPVTISTAPVTIYGSAYIDYSLATPTWFTGSITHSSTLDFTGTAGNVTITAPGGETVMSGFKIISGTAASDIHVLNTNAAISWTHLSSLKAEYATAGTRTLKATYNQFSDAIPSGSDVAEQGIEILVADALALPMATVEHNVFYGGNVNTDTSKKWEHSFYFHDVSLGMALPAVFSFQRNDFYWEAGDFSESITLSGPNLSAINANKITHDGSGFDAGIYAVNGPSLLTITNNVMTFGNTGGVQVGSYGVLAVETNLMFINNTIVHDAAVNTGYGVYSHGEADVIYLANNLFDNHSTTTAQHLVVSTAYTTGSATLQNNLFWSGNEDQLPSYYVGTSYLDEVALDATAPTKWNFSFNVYDEDPALDASYSPTNRIAVVDAGYTPAWMLTTPTYDVNNNVRVIDGNLDGTAVLDIGAVELTALPIINIDLPDLNDPFDPTDPLGLHDPFGGL